MTAERTWTIGDLNRRASLAVVKEFRGRIWTVGELSRLDERRGNRWLELVERGGGREGRDAHLEAFCSATRWLKLSRKLADAGIELRVGQRLVIAGCLEIGDRGKLSLTVEDVDVDALVGDRLRTRRELVRRLIADDLFDANRRLVLPRLPLRVGVVASAGSDGHRDLMRQLEGSGLAFEVTLRSVPVEGSTAPRAIQAALATLGPAEVDVALMVRGGGAKASLDVFDRAPVAHAVATALVPVWTGIGHTGDRTVADEVAHRTFGTPTAVGQELVATVAGAWAEVAGTVAGIARLVDARLAGAGSQLDGRRREIATLAGSQVARHEHAQARTSSDLRRSAARCLAIRSGHLAMAAHAIRASGVVELRDARRQLANLAADASQAARTTCVDAGDDLAAAARRVSTGVAGALAGAWAPVGATAAQLSRARFEGVLDQQAAAVAGAATRVERGARRRLDDHEDRAGARRAVLEAYDPRRQLARGWTLTRTADGRLVRDARELVSGDTLVTTFASGTAASTVTEVHADE
jgi:exodeoxyribonuclease VII large subunit